MHSCNFCRKIVVFNCASAYLLEFTNASPQILPDKASAYPMLCDSACDRRVTWMAATPLIAFGKIFDNPSKVDFLHKIPSKWQILP